MSDIERDLDPPSPQEPLRIKSWWIGFRWEDGAEDTLNLEDHQRDAINEIERTLDEIQYEVNRDILEHQAQKYGDPDSDY
jgi:Spy/CpxP family protein refolding chaperone